MKYLDRRARACQLYEIDHAKGFSVKPGSMMDEHFKVYSFLKSFSCAAGDEVESLLLVVELGLGEVDRGGAGGGAHEVQL